MHICIPDTREVRPAQGSAYLLYNVHIDGLYHCSLRYKQLLHLHQTLTKAFIAAAALHLPPFPPKKLLPLSSSQVEERRLLLEKYLQNISQDKAICSSPVFNLFLLEAQRESTRIREDQVHLDIELVNGQKMRLQIVTHDSADAILTAACRALGLQDRYHAYFCLCLCGYDVVRDKLIIKRRFSFFESPYITLQMAVQQQEQIQNVLAATCYNNNNGNPINNNNNTNTPSCRYCSCTSHAPTLHGQANNLTTGLPHLGSSSGLSCNNNHNNQHNLNQNLHNGSKSHHHPTTTTTTTTHQDPPNDSARTLSSPSCCFGRNGRHHTSSLSKTSLARNFVTHRILLRKSYWDPVYDTYILGDQQALNLLFIQTVYDMQHSLMFVDRKTYHQLESLLASDSKLEYILLARTLKYYNYVHFEPCLSDYPRPRTKVMISIGSKELNMRVLKSPFSLSSPSPSTAIASTTISTTTTVNNTNNSTATSPETNGCKTARSNPQTQVSSSIQAETSEHILYCTSSLVPTGYQHLITRDNLVEEEYNFKVPLIRCWRLTSLETLNSNTPPTQPSSMSSTLRRKSLSLFGGGTVTNNNNNNNNNHSADLNGRSNCGHNLSSSYDTNTNGRSLITSGFGGRSLLTALSTTSTPTPETLLCYNEQQQPSSGNPDKQQHQAKSDCCSCHLMQRNDHNLFSQYELSFEYLISKDTLRWITISSDQAIFISISLQGVVDELVSRRNTIGCPLFNTATSSTTATSLKTNGSIYSNAAIAPSTFQPVRPQTDSSQQALTLPQSLGCLSHSQNFSYMFRDGSQKLLSTGNQQLLEKFAVPLITLQNGSRQRQLLLGSSRSGLLSMVQGNHNNVAGLTGSGTYSLMGYASGSNTNYHQSSSNETNLIDRASNSALFEISNFKKAPSPIINDAFEGVANDDDL